MSDTQFLLGKLVEGDPGRDAVHIAVAPATARITLSPGEDVGIFANGEAGTSKSPIGIVDPFLKANVKEGERFWIFLYPNTITSLKHLWTHPAFEEPKGASQDQKAASEAWLREFIANADCPGYEETIGAAVSGHTGWDDDYLHFDGMDAHGEIPKQFWDHLEIVTGRKITKRPTYFSCAC
jgi:hypothetical protein